MNAAEVADLLVKAVGEATGRQRLLRKHRMAIVRDTALLLMGVRAGVLFDYCLLAPALLSSVVHALRQSGLDKGKELVVAEVEGCSYLLNLGALKRQPMPRLISFSHEAGGCAVQWATPEETQMAEADFRAVLDCLQCADGTDVTAALVQPSNGSTGVESPLPITALTSIPGAPLLPTLNGWLLGYPVVYRVNEDSVSAASLALSLEPLVRYSLQVLSPALQEAGKRAGWSEARHSMADSVAAFTIPGHLWSGKSSAGVDAWHARVNEACAQAPEELWSEAQLSCEQITASVRF
eukprot:jgi/Botrbrau1/3746/Bobra.0363s0024.1